MYVSELITLNEINKWKKGDNILIKSQTGSGKSHFIMNTLAPLCQERKMKILIFSNRDLLKQQNQRLAFTNIACLNYQFLEKFDKTKLEEKLKEYDIVNFDECHYFFKDSNFNANTDKILRYALEKTNQIKIFSSATPEPLCATNLNFNYQYDIPHDFSYIQNIIFYDNIEDVLAKIALEPAKSVCFFSNASDACAFALSNKDIASFLCSKSNVLWKLADQNAKEEIVQNSKFSSKILATTTVLDNGVNLIDPNLKNVVIDFYDPVTIVQALGRKRAQPGDKISLYIKMPSKSDLQKKAFAKTRKFTLASQLYSDFLNAYFKDVKSVGFAAYWCNYFGFDTAKADYISKYDRIRAFMEQHCNQIVNQDELEKLFSAFIPLKHNSRIVTYNKFMRANLIHFRIESKIVTKNYTRANKWFIYPD